MKRFTFFYFLVISQVFFVFLHSKERLSPFTLSLELSSKYMWRGIEYGSAPTIFPSLTYNYKGFNAFAMGGYAFNGSHQEVDLGVCYTFKGFSIGLSDYYYPSSVGEKDKYLEFNNKKTAHCVEAFFTASPEKIPLSLTFSTYIYGADKRLNGNQAFSSYLELSYNYDFNSNNSLSLGLGASLNKSFYTNYEENFHLVNVLLKYSTSFRFGEFVLPVSSTYIFNPYMDKSYFTFSLYFNSK